MYVVVRTWPSRGVWRDPAWWRGIAVSVIVAAVLVVPFVIPAARLHAAGEMRRPLAHMELWSINPYDFFLPNLWHPLWGAALRDRFPAQGSMWVERGIVLGYVSCAAALLGLTRGWPRRLIGGLFAVGACRIAIALGPSLNYHDLGVRMPLPSWMVARPRHRPRPLGSKAQGLRHEIVTTGRTPVLLPSFFLYYLFPCTSSMRTMSRVWLRTNVLTAALAVYGALVAIGWASRCWGRSGRLAVVAVIVAAVASRAGR